MSGSIYFCCDEKRRNAVRGGALNGIDFVEVLDADAPTEAERQRTLFVHFVNAISETLAPDNVRIEGGERIRDVAVTGVEVDATNPRLLNVTLDRYGDFSIYTLRLVDVPNLDPRLAAVEFSFKAECPTDFDCAPRRIFPPEPRDEPEIDYLAKDYASFRRLMLDRLSVLTPQWSERNAADLGVALVELLAYVGDYLSYQQDAVATEAYLGTARRRVSVRRHARLVDYTLHDGCNARVWAQLWAGADTTIPLPAGTPLLTRIAEQPVLLPADAALLRRADVVFETMHEVEALFTAHNEIEFYTWDDERCCLLAGATRATLRGHLPNLRAGEVLIFEEVLGPLTGAPEDADPSRRHALRLTEVVFTDESDEPLTDPLHDEPITEIAWATDDALPFALCLSARTDAEHGSEFVENVSVARGNVVAADHGLTIRDEPLGTVPPPRLFRPAQSNGHCRDTTPRPIPPRFRPSPRERPLTQAAPYDATSPASVVMQHAVRDVRPAIALESTSLTQSALWHPRRDLLGSGSDTNEFVVETESDGTAFVRFGDDRNGRRPETGTDFRATYRVGNGVAGNVGAESLFHVVSDLPIEMVRNPLAARGGVEPESIEDARQRAPFAFRTQQRAVTPDDYAAVTERHAGVQRAAATFRWTGSWHTVFVTADRRGGRAVDAPFEAEIRAHLERFRMAGYDLEIDGPRFVPLEIEMFVCVRPEYFRADVKAALLEVFSNRTLPDGRRGVLHPDNFTFGQPVYLSRLYAAAQAVPGVASVQITKFGRQGQTDPAPLADGKISLHRLEIARLDNDPNFVERGVFRLEMGGGK